MKKRTDASRGFSLVELMVVMSMLAVMSGMALPSLSRLLDKSKLGTQGQALFHALSLGRSEAIKRGNRVVICKSAEGRQCSRAGGWEQGWIVFHDRNNNAQVDSGETVLLREQALPSRLRLKGNRPVAQYVSYTPLGHTSTTSGGFQAGTFTLCIIGSSAASEGRLIVISNTGRARSSRVKLAQCL